MKLFFILNIFLLIIFTKEDTVSVTITATSGIVNKVKNSKTKILSFIIPCQVDKNITNKISTVDITFKTKRPDPNDNKQFDVICNLNQVRLDSDDNYANTFLSCQLNYSNYENDADINLVIVGTPSYTSDIVVFTFAKLTQIGQSIEISGLYIFNSDSNNCFNNHYNFKMNFTSFNNEPLESTVCNIAISNNDVHNTARCAIPIGNNYDIICSIDISEEKIEKGEKIEINSQSLVNCENGQILKIGDNAKNILEIDEDCDKSFFLFFTKFYLYILFLILF